MAGTDGGTVPVDWPPLFALVRDAGLTNSLPEIVLRDPAPGLGSPVPAALVPNLRRPYASDPVDVQDGLSDHAHGERLKISLCADAEPPGTVPPGRVPPAMT